MNPLAVQKGLQIASGAGKRAKELANSGAGQKVILGAGVLTALYLINRWMVQGKIKQNVLEAQNRYGTKSKSSHAISLASRFHTSMHKLAAWLWDGTDEKAIYEAAYDMVRQGVPFSAVATEYKKLYNRILLKDLTNELDDREIKKFHAILQSPQNQTS
ncbi:hypothetical protein FUAX_09790 [Fulvitalea axinellae]|uniref:Uncharacterized protein n=1 Tax=Fulvitalea axinellae TaxID=1182444 RepID=A0AAU9CKV0_9BACT|nr:hypothetical protein FUAX_09790 [Fulvitalea axinellae]